MAEHVCKNCRFIIQQGTVCPICGSTQLTSKWNGQVLVLNVDKSELAKKLGIKVNGVFAISVKE